MMPANELHMDYLRIFPEITFAKLYTDFIMDFPTRFVQPVPVRLSDNYDTDKPNI